MKGHKRYRSGGWRLAVFAGIDPKTGRKRYIYETVRAVNNRAGAKAADARLAQLIAEVEGGRVPERRAPRAAEVLRLRELAERWQFDGSLRDIPADLDLWQAPEAAVGPGSAADRLWRRLADLPRVTSATAGKLLARERPRLIPVHHLTVMTAVGRHDTDEWWRPLRTVLDENPELIVRLEQLRRLAAIDSNISLLRVLDACVWMGATIPNPYLSTVDR